MHSHSQARRQSGLMDLIHGYAVLYSSLLVLALPSVPADQLIGSLLAWRAVYYLLPLLVAALLFAAQELRAQRSTLARIEQLAAAYISPVVPQVTPDGPVEGSKFMVLKDPDGKNIEIVETGKYLVASNIHSGEGSASLDAPVFIGKH